MKNTCANKCCFDCKAHGTTDCLISCILEKRCTSESVQSECTCKAFERKDESEQKGGNHA